MNLKLENIISGHRINEDDADWLRALESDLGARSTAAQPLTLSHEEIDRVFNEHEEAPQISYRYWVANALLAAANEKSPTAAAQPPGWVDEAAGQIEHLDRENNRLAREAWTWSKACEAATRKLHILSTHHPRLEVRYWTGSYWEPMYGVALDRLLETLAPAPPAATGDSTPPSEPAGLTDDRIKRHTLRAADCPPDSKVLLVSSVRRFLAAQGDPSGAPRAEPEAVGPDCHGLDTPERVRFYEHDFYVLSNFSAFNVAQGGFMFQTAEHLYHYMKFARPWGDEDRGKPIDWSGPEILVAQAIFGATSAHEAFKIAEQNKALRRPDWDQVKVSFMRDILRAKAMQHSYVLRKLLATGDRELVEDSWRDDFWGWGPNRDGKNMLGRLWMEVRAEFRAAEPPQAASGERGD